MSTGPGRRLVTGVLWAALLLAALATMPSCKRTPPAAPTTNRIVVVTIFPLYDLVRELAGTTVQVKLLLPGSVSPHEYALTPADAQWLDKADLVVAVGEGLDDWMLDAIDDPAGSGGVRVVRLMTDTPENDAKDEVESTDEHGHGHSTINPHQWLVPRRMAGLVGDVSKQLQALYPNQSAAFRDREFDVQMMLAELDLAYEDGISQINDRRVIMFHDAFGPLAQRYGLNVVATVLDVDTFTAVPARVGLVRRAIEEQGVRAVFSEPQFDASAVRGITGDVTIGVLDPIGGEGIAGYDSYEAMMRSNLAALIAGLRANDAGASNSTEDGGG